MPRYRIGEESIKRKNAWMPCVINAAFDDMTPAEQAKAFRATRWADNVTNSEWPALLDHEGVPRYIRSRLKKKIVGWLMVLGRVSELNPALFTEAFQEAQRLYEQQLGHPHPVLINPQELIEQDRQRVLDLLAEDGMTG